MPLFATATATATEPAPHDTTTEDIAALESNVRSYSRSWPVVFDRAVGATLTSVSGDEYLDFFAGAGALNYGHNHPVLKRVLLDYLSSDRIVHSLDMFTAAREDFLRTFAELILTPRGCDYRVMFPGPGGTNAVEAALKLARKVTGRETVVYFSNAFHGMTLGALATTANAMKRAGAGVPLTHTVPVPYDRVAEGDEGDTARLRHFERLLADAGGGPTTPAAVIVETVQGEGGVNVASPEWLRELERLCRAHGVLLILDDVQMGCGRTGGFFSFEEAGIDPDIVCLSKSISGSGLPLALTLLRPELDIWEPGEHNGTFRGFAPAFVTATAAIREFWADDTLQQSTLRKGRRIENRFGDIAAAQPGATLIPKGRGLARGLQLADGALASAVASTAFARGLLVETSGPEGEVVKLLPPLTISDAELDRGLAILEDSVREVLAR